MHGTSGRRPSRARRSTRRSRRRRRPRAQATTSRRWPTPEHPAGGVAGRVQPDQAHPAAAAGPDARGCVGGDRRGAGQPGADVVGRVGDPGMHDDVAGAEPEQRRQPRHQLLGPDRSAARRPGRGPAPPRRRANQPATASRSAGGAAGLRVAGGVGRAGRARPATSCRGGVDRGADGQVDDPAGVGPGAAARSGGEPVPGEVGQRRRPTAAAVRRAAAQLLVVFLRGQRRDHRVVLAGSGPAWRHRRASRGRRRTRRSPCSSPSTARGRRPRSRWPRPGRPARTRRSRRTRRGGCTASARPRRCSRPGTPRCRPCP